MKTNAYLMFDGRCEEAFRLYEAVLGGRLMAMMSARGTPVEAHVPPHWADKVLHACLDIGGTLLMGSDEPPGAPGAREGGRAGGFCVNLTVETPEEAERVFAALSEGGTVTMPMGPTFWAQRYGMLTDRFGTPWMVNCFPPADQADCAVETAAA